MGSSSTGAISLTRRSHRHAYSAVNLTIFNLIEQRARIIALSLMGFYE
ncbi:hypothetical protein HMPREF0454_00471 [Hafnia alvei ATCC 51873]|uniref:Uncharacterized protein n=1 Tax=Hafnia alvei ATCC 51873 TaxID=1002364 RepID=G9Y1Q4_HAFAL|nr:hypothetical protein HMPREF0454_00471 [Hafnia alvei ATCC 51873]